MAKQSGFAVIEIVLAAVVLIAVAAAGYFVVHDQKGYQTPVASSAASAYQNATSPTTATVAAPNINSASDLKNALSAIDNTSVSSNNSDSTQLGTQASSLQ